MKIYEFYNRSNHYVEVTDQNGNIIVFKPREIKRLSEYFLKYTPKTLMMLKSVNIHGVDESIVISKPKFMARMSKEDMIKQAGTIKEINTPFKRQFKITNISRNKFNFKIGRTRKDPHIQTIFDKSIQQFDYSISNNIGVGILSYNRLDSLKRLINSIRKYTDLSQTKVFVSDESDNQSVKKWLDEQHDIIFINNKDRLGVAGNSNRLLQALSRFDNILLLNDDVEILSNGWERFYFDIMTKTNFKHFCYRQNGIYGAKDEGSINIINGVSLHKISDKPHGAVLALKKEVIDKIGYFNEKFEEYGMEHVDYSRRVYLADLQPEGFFDVIGSENYFFIHNEKSVGNKIKLIENRKKFDRISDIYCKFSDRSKLDGVSVIIPMRYKDDRIDSLYTVINNIRAQHFPAIEIIICEEDRSSKLNIDNVSPITYKFIKSNNKFNKSAAFNMGISIAKYEKIILHDADICVPSNYVTTVSSILNKYDSCHIGSKVLYLDKDSTDKINKTHIIKSGKVTRMAFTTPPGSDTTMFIGGSICANKSVLIDIGGFDENFSGWGEEDLAFYISLKHHTKMWDNRSINFIHLYHKQSPDVYNKSRKNLKYYKSISPESNTYKNRLRNKFKAKYGL